MKELPPTDVYLQEYEFLPWGKVVNEVIKFVAANARPGSTVLDAMCGPGFVVGNIKSLQPQIVGMGFDISSGFIQSARIQHPDNIYYVQDALTWSSDIKYDFVICTAGVHHLPYERQNEYVAKLARATNKNGICIIADPVIPDFNSEKSRKLASSKLGAWYIDEAIRAGAPDKVIEAMVDVMHNDVLKFEYKSSVPKLRAMYADHFDHVTVEKVTGPRFKQFGDYIFYCTH